MLDTEPSFAARALFGIYKSVVSPVLHAFSPSQCLYLPTCSEYAYIALTRFGTSVFGLMNQPFTKERTGDGRCMWRGDL